MAAAKWRGQKTREVQWGLGTNLRYAGAVVVVDVGVMLSLPRRRHQNID